MKAEIAYFPKYGIFIKPLDDLVQILHTFLRPGEGFPLFRQFCLAAFFVLRQHFQLEILPEHTDITQCLPYGFQHNPVKHLFPDIVDFAGAGVALVIGADEMVLRLILVGIAGIVIELRTAVGTVDKAGENAGFPCLCRSALVRP